LGKVSDRTAPAYELAAAVAIAYCPELVTTLSVYGVGVGLTAFGSSAFPFTTR